MSELAVQELEMEPRFAMSQDYSDTKVTIIYTVSHYQLFNFSLL